jgi:Mg2+ and Co2+ transporter CorA
MAQKDSKVMMELAADSKRDSSAMKTISILGMLFLPGTFVAVSQV